MSRSARAPELDPAVPPTAAALLRHLFELRNVKEGLPISSHRARIGPLVVWSKATFRSTVQPFINELFHKQTLFNETTGRLAEAIYRDLRSLEGGTLAMRASVDRRLSAIEERLVRIEERLANLAPPQADAAPSRPQRASGRRS